MSYADYCVKPIQSTKFPTTVPTTHPTAHPTRFPTTHPTNYPTRFPTNFPTTFPTNTPTRRPTRAAKIIVSSTKPVSSTKSAHVKCMMTIDNYIESVKYNGVTLTSPQSGSWHAKTDGWDVTRTYEFDTVDGAYLDVVGREDGHGGTCLGTQCSGFAMECQDPDGGAWDKFGTAADDSVTGENTCHATLISSGYAYPKMSTTSSGFYLKHGGFSGQGYTHQKIWPQDAKHNEPILFRCAPKSTAIDPAHAGTFQCGCKTGYECSDPTTDPHCLTCKATAAPTALPTSSPTAPSRPTCTLSGNNNVKLERCSDVAQFVDSGANCLSGTAGEVQTFKAPSTTISLATPGTLSCSQSSKAEVIFVIDASGSVGSRNFKKVLDTVKNIVDKLDIGADGVRVGVLRYASKNDARRDNPQVSIELGSTNVKAELVKKIEAIAYTGGLTYTANAIDKTRLEMFSKARPNVPKIVMVVTDGESTDGGRNDVDLIDKANQLRSLVDPSGAGSDGIVYALGIATNNMGATTKRNIDREMNAIATPGYAQMIANFDVLSVTANVLVDLICTSSGGIKGAPAASIDTSEVGEYTLSYTAANPIDTTLVSKPVTRTVTIIDTTGPKWSTGSAVIVFEAADVKGASATIAAAGVLPTASNKCSSTAPTVQLRVSPAAAVAGDDLTTFYCGLGAIEGATKAADVAAAATVAQDLSTLVGVCGRYTVKWTAMDAAANKNTILQEVYVRDTSAPDITKN